MVIRTKKKPKLHKLKNEAYDLMESWIYAVADSSIDDDSLEYVLSSSCAELNKIEQNKYIIVYTPKRMRRVKKILDQAIYSHQLYDKILSLLKIFGIN